MLDIQLVVVYPRELAWLFSASRKHSIRLVAERHALLSLALHRMMLALIL